MCIRDSPEGELRGLSGLRTIAVFGIAGSRIARLAGVLRLRGGCPGSRNNGVFLADFLGQSLVAEILAAHRAIPIFLISGFRRGGRLGFCLLRFVALGGDYKLIPGGFVLAGRISEIFAASGAVPVFLIAGLSAGGFLGLFFLSLVSMGDYALITGRHILVVYGNIAVAGILNGNIVRSDIQLDVTL